MTTPVPVTPDPAVQMTIATRAANEGIPVAAIARIVQQPYEVVVEMLHNAAALGQIGEVPKTDWPAGVKWGAHLPSVPRTANHEDVEFACRTHFRLTGLEAGFMVVLLRYSCADKERLHNVIETQRQARSALPNSLELTDPKMVDVIVCKLRKKLKLVNPEVKLQTSWGKGYFFDAETKHKIYGILGEEFTAAVTEDTPVSS